MASHVSVAQRGCRIASLLLVKHQADRGFHGVGRWNEVSDSAIERRELSIMTQRHRKQMRVCDLTVTDEPRLVDEIAGGNRYVVVPKDMVGKCDDSAKEDEGFPWRASARKNVCVRRDAHESALG